MEREAFRRGAADKRAGTRCAPIAISLLIHSLLLVGLLYEQTGAGFGYPGPDAGAGIPVALIDGVAAGALPDIKIVAFNEPDNDPSAHRAQHAVHQGWTPAADQPAQWDNEEERRASAEASSHLGDSGDAAGEADGAAGSTASEGGDPFASNLLDQVARCLPHDYRPTLGLSQLTLAIGADGGLRAAPEVRSSLPRLTDAERLAADRIVQAALQCGPYTQPNLVNRVVSLAADFSAIQPRVVGVDRADAQAGQGANEE